MEPTVYCLASTEPQANEILTHLRNLAFSSSEISILLKDRETKNISVKEDVVRGARKGGIAGGVLGALAGLTALTIPAVGPLLVAGPVSAAIVAALESAVVVGGVSVLGAALYSIGIPKDSVLRYETAIKVNKYLLVAHGTAAEVTKAKGILKTTNPAEIDEHVLGKSEA